MEFTKASIEQSTALLEGDQKSPFTSPEGINNSQPLTAQRRILKGSTYRDMSTVIVLPTPTDFIHHKVEGAIDSLMKPMNQKCGGPLRLSGQLPVEMIQAEGFEVADAYNNVLKQILEHPDMKNWKFMLTIEHDNLPAPDGLVMLQRAMYDHAIKDDRGRVLSDENGIPMFKFLAIGGLYWVKGEEGQPMIYGNPKEPEGGFQPQVPIPGEIQECRGVAMGFTLWNLQALLKDTRLGPPWFESRTSWTPDRGVAMGTQDLVFCGKALPLGYRFAVDNKVLVGHLDFKTGMVW